MVKMAKGTNQKLKLLYIQDYLLKNTDENHAVTVKDIIAHLDACGISAERKSIYDDIELLKLNGLDICTEKRERTVWYNVVSRNFEIYELKLLASAVQGSRFITEKKSDELIKKLESECSRFAAYELDRQLTVANRIKSMNESIYFNVDKIHNAIRDNRKISFLYFDYNIKKEKIYRHNGKKYTVSPFALNWDDENYYLVAYDSENSQIRHYRVDKMDKLSEDDGHREGFDMFDKAKFDEYSKKVFSMFGGESVKVGLEFSERLISVVIDRFGKDVFISPGGDGKTFRIDTDIVVSPNFYGWVFSFGKDAKILYPQSAIDGFKEYLNDVTDIYK